MCGIVGLIDKTNLNHISQMNELLFHRGPDDSGEFIDREKGIGLAMRRLAIIDLVYGKQPMTNEDESLWIVCNGEIYNSPEIRKKLLIQGHSFKTKNSDVEVLLHLYEEKGIELLEELNGMYAFVIYDKRKKVLFGARDRIGIKPLYFSQKNGKFAFASELKSLLLLPWVNKQINFTSLYHYLSLQFVPAPDSIFSDIKKLPAGHCFTFSLEDKGLKIQKYWKLDVQKSENRTLEEWQELISDKIEEAVKRWTLSDVPVACSLSGGLDSSTVVGLMAKLGIADIKTYSLGFGAPEEQQFNELSLASRVAEKWNTQHHEVVLEPRKVLNELEHMVWHLDEPYGGGLPSWYIYEFISKDCKVAMTGTGGDELFGNYAKWLIFEKGCWYRYLKNIREAIHWRSWRELKNGYTFPHGHFYHSYLSDMVKDEIVMAKKNQQDGQSTEAFLEQVWQESGSKNPRNAVAYIDFNLQLPEEFLLMTDRFSMAHSVEARVPFLDHELVELVFCIPPEVRTKPGDPKYLLKQVVADLLPEELLTAPKKGFILPLEFWTRKDLRPLIEELLSPDYLQHQGIFSNQVYDRLVKPHIRGKKDYTQQVWTLMMFQLWCKVFCNNEFH